jgi:hypothetical protein
MSAQAATLTTITDALTISDPTMLGRQYRTGTGSDWGEAKAYPGRTNTTTAYYYDTYSVAVTSDTPYLQIDITDPTAPSGAIFVTAYWDSFGSTTLTSTNYLGDAGGSGSGFFQVVAPSSGTLVLVVTNLKALGADLNSPFSLLVEGFVDTMYTDPTPEPSSLTLLAGGLAILGLRRYRSRRDGTEKEIA